MDVDYEEENEDIEGDYEDDEEATDVPIGSDFNNLQ